MATKKKTMRMFMNEHDDKHCDTIFEFQQSQTEKRHIITRAIGMPNKHKE